MHIDITWALAANISSCDVVDDFNNFMQERLMAAPLAGGEGGSMVPAEWAQIVQKWCNENNSSYTKGLATRLNVVGDVPLWWSLGLELLPQALMIPPTANLGKRAREQVIPYQDTAFGDGQLHKPTPKSAAAAGQRKTPAKQVLGKWWDNQTKAGADSLEMVDKVEKLRTRHVYRNVGLTYQQAKTIVGLQDAADAEGGRMRSHLSAQESDTAELVGELDFAVLKKNSSEDPLRRELPSCDGDQRCSPQPKKKTGKPKGIDGPVEGEFALLTDKEVELKTAQEKKKNQKVSDSTWINKWRRFTTALKHTPSLDMSTCVLKLAL